MTRRSAWTTVFISSWAPDTARPQVSSMGPGGLSLTLLLAGTGSHAPARRHRTA